MVQETTDETIARLRDNIEQIAGQLVERTAQWQAAEYELAEYRFKHDLAWSLAVIGAMVFGYVAGVVL